MRRLLRQGARLLRHPGRSQRGRSNDPAAGRDTTPPQPAAFVDEPHILQLAGTSQTALLERRAENRRYHDQRARHGFREAVGAVQATLQSVGYELTQLRPRLNELKRLKKARQRFVGRQGADGEKQPATGWEYTKFGALAVFLLLALANGTLTVSSVMLTTPAFEGSRIKAISAGLGLFLMPSLGMYLPFHVLTSAGRKRAARVYLLSLIVSGMSLFVLFAITWAYTYALQTGNDLLLDLTTIGMGDGSDTGADEWWLFANANWLSLLANILADAAFAGAAKAGMTLLANDYALFRRKALQSDPEWTRLDAEEQEVAARLGDLTAEQTQAEDRLAVLRERQEEFAATVVSLADARFLREADRLEVHRRQLATLRDDLAAREQAVAAKRHEIDQALQANPGLHQGAKS